MNVDSLRGKFFLDTNILVYSFDRQAPQKQQTARELIEVALSSQMGVICSQVVQEFLNVAQKKFTKPMCLSATLFEQRFNATLPTFPFHNLIR